MLEVSKLGRRYGDLIAVSDVSFRIEQGEIVGLLGHNGAGKTTIMKMISGYLEPDQGRILFDGADVVANPKAAQAALGYLPESPPVYPELSVADYLDYAATLKGLDATQRIQEVRRVIAATELAGKLLAPINTLSRGYRQRVGVAQALLGHPRLLILDEPTNGLDPTQTEHMRNLIRDAAREATIILSTHIMQEVDALCDRVLILSRGQLAVDEQLADLRHSNRLRLATSLDPDALRNCLSGQAGIEHIENLTGTAALAGHFEYRLTLRVQDESREIAAAAASAIAASGARLYELHTEQRDLESLFREVSSAGYPEGQKNAA